MPDRLQRTLSLVGRAIQDLTFEPLGPATFTAEIADWPRQPQYKSGGFFAFLDVPAGEHTLTLSGTRLQTRNVPLTLPRDSLLLALPGEDEMAVIVTAIDRDQKRISFDATRVPRPIRAGSTVLANGLETTLTADLETGTAVSAQLDDTAGLFQRSIVRFVRDSALRLRHDPYSTVPAGRTRIVGRIGEVADPQQGIAGVTVRLTHVGDAEVSTVEVAGAELAKVTVGDAEHLLGTAADLATETNGNGDYNLYFADADFLTDVTLEIAGAGFQTRTETLAVTANQRTKADFTLARD